MGHGFANLGRGVAHLAVRVDPHVQIALATAQPVVVQQPVASDADVPTQAGPQPQPQSEPDAAPAPAVAPEPAPAVMPAMVVDRVDRSTPTTFVARYRTASGSWTCSTYPTMDECTRICTAMNQQAGMTGAASPQCGCLEDGACP